jgi:transposase
MLPEEVGQRVYNLRAVQRVTGESVGLAYVDQGDTGEVAFDAAADHGIILEVVKLPEAKRGFVLLPRRWVVERCSIGRHGSTGRREITNDCCHEHYYG